MDSDLRERQDAYILELKNIRDESMRKHLIMVESNKKIVDSMHGKILIEDNPAGGTIFRIVFPALTHH